MAIAPVTDLARCYREGLGEGATELFMRGSPRDQPVAYTAATPSSGYPLAARS